MADPENEMIQRHTDVLTPSTLRVFPKNFPRVKYIILLGEATVQHNVVHPEGVSQGALIPIGPGEFFSVGGGLEVILYNQGETRVEYRALREISKP